MPLTRSQAAAERPASRPPSARSAVSNGTKLPGGVSACSAAGRRFVDIIGDLTAELGGYLGPAEELQVRTVAGMMLHVEALQGAMLKGEVVDSEEITRASGLAARMLNALKRKAPSSRRRSAIPHGAPHPLAKGAGE